MFHHIARSYATIPIWQRWLLDGLVVRCMIWCNLKIKISRHCNHFSFAVSWSDNGCMMTVGWAWHERYNLITDATVVGHGATRPAGNPITMTTTNILSMSDIMVTSLFTQNTALPFDAKQSPTLLCCTVRFLGKVLASESVTFLLFVSKFLRRGKRFFYKAGQISLLAVTRTWAYDYEGNKYLICGSDPVRQ